MGEKKILEKCHFSAQNWVFFWVGPIFNWFLAQFLNDLGAFCHFFSAQNWVYPISEQFGSFLAISKIFLHFFLIFLKFFRVFWSEKGRKNIFSKNIIFSAQNWFYPISERFGAFFKIFKTWAIFGNFWNFSLFFFEIFPSFLVWKKGEKKISREMSFFSAQIGFT